MGVHVEQAMPGLYYAGTPPAGVFKSTFPLALEDFRELKQMGIKAIITLNREAYVRLAKRPEFQDAMRFRRKNFKSVFIPLSSKGGIPTMQQLLLFKGIVDRMLGSGQKVLVHCSRGKGRTQTMLLSYKILSGHMSPQQAAEAAKPLEFQSQKRFIEEFHEKVLPQARAAIAKKPVQQKTRIARRKPRRPH